MVRTTYICSLWPTLDVVFVTNNDLFHPSPSRHLLSHLYVLYYGSSTMKSLLYFLILTAFSYANPNPSNVLQKRESGELACYPSDILDFSALCPYPSWPTQNGLNVIEVLYYAMKSTTIPGDTVYQAQENIICTIHGSGPNVTFTAGGQVGDGILSAGAAVTLTLTMPTLDSGGKYS